MAPDDESLDDKAGSAEVFSHMGEHYERQGRQTHEHLHWEGTFGEYIDLVKKNPKVTRNAHQRLHDMIISYGDKEYKDIKKKIIHYKFFDDPDNNGKDAIFGLDVPLMDLVKKFSAASKFSNTRKRMILLHGPVGSSKSTIARLLKQGLEKYSKTEEGALYTLEWDLTSLDEKVLEKLDIPDHLICQMHDEPLKVVPEEKRPEIFEMLRNDGFKIDVEGSLCPACRFIYKKLEEHYKGDWNKIVQHVKVKRLVLSEKDRVGIGTFQPKDEKNQDSTELTGDVNYRKLAKRGADSDAMAFSFDGELNIGNRGLVEFVEILKLDVAFLYDLLGATQEHMIKPKKFAQTDVDEVILGHTNEAEFKKLLANEFMEALRDRTEKVDIPYITILSEAIRVYEKDYGNNPEEPHFAPHTLKMAAAWAVLTRLEEPKKANLSVLQKMKLYNGQSLTGFTTDHIKELRKTAEREGMDGISPRYIQSKIDNALVSDKQEGCVNPFLILNELEAGLKNNTLITNKDHITAFKELITVVKQEYEDIVKNEVQRAMSADESALATLCANYIDNVKAFTQKEKIKNKYTGQYEEPDERLMRSIEEQIDIPKTRADDFRTEIMNYIGALAVEGKQFDYRTNERLQKALELKLFEDQKDTIKLTSLVSTVLDKEGQEKIEVVKQRMIDQYGYCEVCAHDVLAFVGSIFARGQAKEDEE